MEGKRENSRMDFICKWIIILGGAFMFALLLTGCNTVKGFAKDVYSVTEGIQNEMSDDNGRDDSRPDDWNY